MRMAPSLCKAVAHTPVLPPAAEDEHRHAALFHAQAFEEVGGLVRNRRLMSVKVKIVLVVPPHRTTPGPFSRAPLRPRRPRPEVSGHVHGIIGFKILVGVKLEFGRDFLANSPSVTHPFTSWGGAPAGNPNVYKCGKPRGLGRAQLYAFYLRREDHFLPPRLPPYDLKSQKGQIEGIIRFYAASATCR